MNDFPEKTQEIKDYIIDRIDDFEDTRADELHNNLFNTGYYIIGTFKATQWLAENNDTFHAINYIKEYEEGNFGEVNTDFSDPERIANMPTYILGEEVLYSLSVNMDGWLNNAKIEEIKNALA